MFASSRGRDCGNTVSLTDLELHQVRQAPWPTSSMDPPVSLHILTSLGSQVTSVYHDTKLFHRQDGGQTQALLFVSRVLC